MPLFELTQKEITAIEKTMFGLEDLRERADLQRLLRSNISVISPDTLIISEEFGDWSESRRRIDLLGVDHDANLVVIELKRTEDGGHMELQAIRYAAMISTMTFDQAVNIFTRYLDKIGSSGADAHAKLLDHLGWHEADEDAFGQDVRIILASADFSREITSSVLWLNERGIDIQCVRLQPYKFDNDRVLLDVQQIIPLPEVAEYQIRVTEKQRKEREARTGIRDWTTYNVTLGENHVNGLRKRHAIYQVVRYLVESGIPPETVATHCGRGFRRVFASVDNEVHSEDFCLLARDNLAKDGRIFNSERFFSNDEDLLHFQGRTYAFSSQWGGDDWDQAMSELCSAFPDKNISFSPAE